MVTLAYAALVSLLLAADPAYDTVFLQNGGRLRGTVVEETPTGGVTIQIPGGQLRTVAPSEVFRIEYRDGTVGLLGATLAPPPPASVSELPPPTGERPPQSPAAGAAGAAAAAQLTPAAPPPPALPPAAPEPLPERGPAGPFAPIDPVAPPPQALGLFMFAGGLGVASPSGDAEGGVPLEQVAMTQLLIELEAGLRLNPAFMLGLVLDLGIGDAAPDLRAACRSDGGTDCTVLTGRVALQLRYAFQPHDPVNPWVSIGTGYERTSVGYDEAGNNEYLTYGGWEYLRLGAGLDFRTTAGFGWGLFTGAGWGHFNEVDFGLGTQAVQRGTSHAWLQVGARAILFP